MGFEIVTPALAGNRAMTAMTAGLSRNQSLSVATADLEAVGIRGDRVAVLIDRDACQLALRSVRDGEAGHRLQIPKSKARGRREHRRRVSVGSALRQLGLPVGAVAGPFRMTRRDDLLIVELPADLRAATREAPLPGPGRPRRSRDTAPTAAAETN